MTDIDIVKAHCRACDQDTVLTDDCVFTRHRHRPPLNVKGRMVVVNGQAVLGPWCDMTGRRPDDQPA